MDLFILFYMQRQPVRPAPFVEDTIFYNSAFLSSLSKLGVQSCVNLNLGVQFNSIL